MAEPHCTVSEIPAQQAPITSANVQILRQRRGRSAGAWAKPWIGWAGARPAKGRQTNFDCRES